MSPFVSHQPAGDAAAGPVHQPMQGGLPSDHEEVLLPWDIIARIVNTVRVQFYQFITLFLKDLLKNQVL